MDVLERIKRGYRAIGPGAPRDVLAMFHQEQDEAPEWIVEDVGSGGGTYASREVVAMELFAGAMPAHWEVIGVDLRLWDYTSATRGWWSAAGSAPGRAARGRSSRSRSSTSGAWTTNRSAASSTTSQASRSAAAGTSGLAAGSSGGGGRRSEKRRG